MVVRILLVEFVDSTIHGVVVAKVVTEILKGVRAELETEEVGTCVLFAFLIRLCVGRLEEADAPPTVLFSEACTPRKTDVVGVYEAA